MREKELSVIIDNSADDRRKWFTIFLSFAFAFLLPPPLHFSCNEITTSAQGFYSCSRKGYLEWQGLVTANLTCLVRKTPITTSQRQHSELFKAFRTVARRPLSSIWRSCLASFKLFDLWLSFYALFFHCDVMNVYFSPPKTLIRLILCKSFDLKL